MVKRKEIQELYYIRAIAAMGILILHATAGFAIYSEFGSRSMYLAVFLNQFFRFGSPIFMMVSGLVLFYNYRSTEEFDTKKFYKKKVKFILVPYIIWSIIYYLYPHIVHDVPMTQEVLGEFPRALLLGEAYSHLYFIFLIFQFYIVLPLLIKYLAKPMRENPFRVFIFFFIFQGSILIYSYYFKNPNARGFIRLFNRYHWKSLFSWSFYFITGGLIGIHYEKLVNFIENNIMKIFVGYIVSMVLYVGHVYYIILSNGNRDLYSKFGSIRPHTMIYAIFTMPVLIWLSRRMVGKLETLKNFGTYSFGVYFAHPLILGEILRNLRGHFPNHIGYSRLSSLMLVCGLGVVFTFLFVLLIGMLKYRWLLIGKVPKYRFKSVRREKAAQGNIK